MHLEPTRIRSWKDLVAIFMKQYEYNGDSVPDRFQLQNMAKKEVKDVQRVCFKMEKDCCSSRATFA